MEYWKCEDCGDPVDPGCTQCDTCLYRYQRIQKALTARLTPDEIVFMDLEDLKQEAKRPGKPFVLPWQYNRKTFQVHQHNHSGGRRVIRKGTNFD